MKFLSCLCKSSKPKEEQKKAPQTVVTEPRVLEQRGRITSHESNKLSRSHLSLPKVGQSLMQGNYQMSFEQGQSEPETPKA